MTVDLFALRPYDTEALGEVIDLLTAHCDARQCEQFLADLTHWHRLQGHRVPARERDDARRQLEEWQQFISSLREVPS
jgi:hypothetical protein